MKIKSETLFWLLAAVVLLGIIAACNQPHAKFMPGSYVVHRKVDDFKMVVAVHCRPFADYCTYDLADAAWDQPEYQRVSELWLASVTNPSPQR